MSFARGWMSKDEQDIINFEELKISWGEALCTSKYGDVSCKPDLGEGTGAERLHIS